METSEVSKQRILASGVCNGHVYSEHMKKRDVGGKFWAQMLSTAEMPCSVRVVLTFLFVLYWSATF